MVECRGHNKNIVKLIKTNFTPCINAMYGVTLLYYKYKQILAHKV